MQRLEASDGSVDDYFGISVSLGLDTILVGAPGNDGGGENSGAAYVFTRDDTAWIQRQKLKPGNAAVDGWFGQSVAIRGETIVVGAGKDSGVGSEAGAAYIYRRGVTRWIKQYKLTASDGAEYDHFGSSVAIAGDALVIGSGSDSAPGAADVFALHRGQWYERQSMYRARIDFLT